MSPPFTNTGRKSVEPSCSSLMSMFDPFFHGRSVLVRPFASLIGGPAFGAGLVGSGGAAILPGDGWRVVQMPGLASGWPLFQDGEADGHDPGRNLGPDQ